MRRLCPLVVVVVLGGSAARADTVDDLGRVLSADPSPRVRMQAANKLGRVHDPRTMGLLTRALSDGNESVRGVAAAALGELGNPAATAALQRAKRDPSPFVRDQAQLALDGLSAAAPVDPPAPRGVQVVIGGVGSRTSTLPPPLVHRLREAVAEELKATSGVVLATSAPSGYVVDAAVTRLLQRTTDSSVEVLCEVSLILGQLPSRKIVMTTTGEATSRAPVASFRHEHEQALQMDAIEGAVRGAHASLAAYLKTRH